MLHLSGVNADRLDLKYIIETKSIDFSDATTKAIYKQKLIDTFGSKVNVNNLDYCSFNYSNGGCGLRYGDYTSANVLSNASSLFTIDNIRIPKEMSLTFTAANAYGNSPYYWLLFWICISINSVKKHILSIQDASNGSSTNNFYIYVVNQTITGKPSYNKHTFTIREGDFQYLLNNDYKDVENKERCNIIFHAPTITTASTGNRVNINPVYIHNFSITY